MALFISEESLVSYIAPFGSEDGEKFSNCALRNILHGSIAVHQLKNGQALVCRTLPYTKSIYNVVANAMLQNSYGTENINGVRGNILICTNDELPEEY